MHMHTQTCSSQYSRVGPLIVIQLKYDSSRDFIRLSVGQNRLKRRMKSLAAHELRVVHGSISCDPTQPISWLTQPNTTHYKWKNLDPTQPSTANNGACSLVVTYFYTQNLSVSGICQIGRKIKFNCLVKPNLI